MCGRMSLALSRKDFEDFLLSQFPSIDFSLFEKERYKKRFNISPGDDHPIIFWDEDRPKLRFMRWGLVPPWAKDSSVGHKMINARSETIFEKASFKEAAKHRRCLVPIGSYYEWKRDGKNKTPYRFHHKEKPLLFLSGIFEKWRGESGGAPLRTFSLITRDADQSITEIHHRMPVLLPEFQYQSWLTRKNIEEKRDGEEFFPPCSELSFYRVGDLVNNARNDSADCFDAAGESGQLGFDF